MKTVTYYGKTFKVPDWATHIAADADGQVNVYDKAPRWRSSDQIFVADTPGGRHQVVGYFDKREPMEIK